MRDTRKRTRAELCDRCSKPIEPGELYSLARSLDKGGNKRETVRRYHRACVVSLSLPGVK